MEFQASPLSNQLRVADVVASTEAEGPGRRFAIWLQGCPLRCPECCNPEMLSFSGGHLVAIEELVRQIESARHNDGIEGITLLGGEPTAQAEAAGELAAAVKRLGLSVMLFSGYTLRELKEKRDSAIERLLGATDILVDGPYLRELPDTNRRWIGSRNQVIHFLSSRYRADDPCWQMPNSIEIRLDGRELSINGFPARAATGLWRRVGKGWHVPELAKGVASTGSPRPSQAQGRATQLSDESDLT
jgi:anaerobic ribonucleoside-triphosphate reductase activating protein